MEEPGKTVNDQRIAALDQALDDVDGEELQQRNATLGRVLDGVVGELDDLAKKIDATR